MGRLRCQEIDVYVYDVLGIGVFWVWVLGFCFQKVLV
jgi:hypothetical protein